MRWLDSVLEATGMCLTKLREAVEDRSAWRALVHGVTKKSDRTKRLNNNHNIYRVHGVVAWPHVQMSLDTYEVHKLPYNTKKQRQFVVDKGQLDI